MTAEAERGQSNNVDTAADWFARRRSGNMSLLEARDLEVWLESDPDHLAAYRSVARAWGLALSVSTDPSALQLRESALGRFALRRHLRWLGSAAAMTALLATGLYAAGTTGLWRDWFSPVSDQSYRTAVGQTVTVTLADGSTAMLDSDTVMDVHETWRSREVRLARGQAFFRVAKDSARPFVVSATDGSVTATGTAFDVRVDPDQLTVLLVEGKLHVDLPGSASRLAQQTEMVAGWQLTASADGERALTRLDSERQARALGWQTGRLAFVGQSVSTVASELNRYSMKKIVLAPDLARLSIDGVFRAGDIDGFVRLLVKGRLARVQNDTDAAITLASVRKPR
jgi:transmembrane sensor